MDATTIGVDLAKNVFEVAVADERYRVQSRQRLTHARFARFCANHPKSEFVMEACGSAHYWGRRLKELGHEVRLLPAQYVKAYVKRNKTDAADAAALIEASRCADIPSVPVKSVEQQAVQQLHRLREQFKGTRNARINQLRGMLREVGIVIPQGVAKGLTAIREALAIADNGLPDMLRPWVAQLLEEVTHLKELMSRLERELKMLVREDAVVQRLMTIPGVAELVASGVRTAVGDIQRFKSGRHLASWIGLTAREHSSAERRRLGRMSKEGDTYLRMLLINGARSVLAAAQRKQRAGQPLDGLRRWALATAQRRGHNKATVALANKLARIIWATWRHERPFDGNWALSAA
ncbi:MAG TPA: IS110 family transposase [Gammaproteobacteria bacterium]|nr:IS110 family transposase [Gammaproteobacteria bacterium]